MHVVEEAKQHALALGVSLNAYILFAVSEQVKRTRRELYAPVTTKARPNSKPRPPGVPEAKASPADIKRPHSKVGRNEICPCGSGRKAKHCHPEWT